MAAIMLFLPPGMASSFLPNALIPAEATISGDSAVIGVLDQQGLRRQGLSCYCFTSSTRLFLALFSSLSLFATGEREATPYALRRAG